MDDLRNLIVIGASAGGIAAVRELVKQIPEDVDLAVFVVIHLSRRSDAKVIAGILQKHTGLICKVPSNGEEIKNGHLYLAPQDHHMIVNSGKIIINQGVRENKYRPSIDVMFRSAAVHYGSRVIGIVLTGMLEDGTAGMSAVERCGGICIVQDPSDAEFSDMPQSVLNVVKVDQQLKLEDMGQAIENIFNKPVPPSISIPRELQIEAEITESMTSSIDKLKQMADNSDFICPECGGGLWAVRNDPTHRYRCHTGHVYTEQILADNMGMKLEESVWVSIRMLEERRNLLLLMATHSEQANDKFTAKENRARANDIVGHIDVMKDFLTKLTKDLSPAVISRAANDHGRLANGAR